MLHTKVLIVGAGPAGLALASELKDSQYIIVDMGSSIELRDHNDAKDSIIGVGGAGLFSDGKFSFYPAGTKVWDLKSPTDTSLPVLEAAYDNLKTGIAPYLQSVPAFPEEIKSGYSRPDKWFLKKYPCMYLTLDQRKAYVNDFVAKIPSSNLWLGCQFVSYIKSDNVYYCTLLKDGKEIIVATTKLVIGSGRFGPLTLEVEKIYRRIEYGVRIQFKTRITEVLQKADNRAVSVPDDGDQSLLLDPKYIRLTEWGEIRTFCWCKRGEVVLTDHMGIKSYSGRSDITQTEYNNFGFNIRIKDPTMFGETNMFEFLKTIEPFSVTSVEAVAERYGPILGPIIEKSLNEYLDAFPALKIDSEKRFVGPTVEGVGYYPNIDPSTLKVGDEEIYCIGDCSGIFRGIIPSMLSGYYLAQVFNASI